MKQVFFSLAALVGMSVVATPAMAENPVGHEDGRNTQNITVTVAEIAELAWGDFSGRKQDLHFTITSFEGGVDPEAEVRRLHFLTNAPATVFVTMAAGDIPPGTTLTVEANGDHQYASDFSKVTWTRDVVTKAYGAGDPVRGTTQALFKCRDVVANALSSSVSASMFVNGGYVDLEFKARNRGGQAPDDGEDTATLLYTIMVD